MFFPNKKKGEKSKMDKLNETVDVTDGNEKLTITIDEAVELTDIGKNHMLELAKLESFPAIKFKRKIYINRKQFEKWLDDLTAGRIII